MAEVFQLRPYFEWRGLGFISQSALRIRTTNTREWDAEQRFHVPGIRVTDPKAAQCGEVLKGVLKPHQCKLVRPRVHAGTSDWRADGFIGRIMRRLSQLRTPQDSNG